MHFQDYTKFQDYISNENLSAARLIRSEHDENFGYVYYDVYGVKHQIYKDALRINLRHIRESIPETQ